MIVNHLKQILRGKKSLKDVWYYIQGHYRYKLYYSKHRWLIRRHIREQIKRRIVWMNDECLDQGSCVICGCETTELQMCNKSCDKPCYPPMMTATKWKYFKNGALINHTDGRLWLIENRIPKLYTIGELHKKLLDVKH